MYRLAVQILLYGDSFKTSHVSPIVEAQSQESATSSLITNLIESVLRDVLLPLFKHLDKTLLVNAYKSVQEQTNTVIVPILTDIA